ncbi:MAG: hypothetical protein ACLRTA_02465 [Clostridia bacterium]
MAYQDGDDPIDYLGPRTPTPQVAKRWLLAAISDLPSGCKFDYIRCSPVQAS